MSIHTPHPDTHEHGLADDCPRCAEHSADPLRGLDSENLLNLIERVLDWDDGSYPRSENEATAMRTLEPYVALMRGVLNIDVRAAVAAERVRQAEMHERIFGRSA